MNGGKIEMLRVIVLLPVIVVAVALTVATRTLRLAWMLTRLAYRAARRWA